MTLKALFSGWLERYFSDEEAVILLLLLIVGTAAVVLLGGMLAPFLTALVIAFLLQGAVNWLTRRHVPNLAAVLLVYLGFLGILLAMALIVMPLKLARTP